MQQQSPIREITNFVVNILPSHIDGCNEVDEDSLLDESRKKFPEVAEIIDEDIQIVCRDVIRSFKRRN